MDNVCLACVAWVVKMSQTFRNGSSLVILPLEMIEIWSFASSMSDPKWPRTMPCHFKCAWAIVYVCPACFPDLKIVLSSGGFMISQLFTYTTRLALILLLRLLCCCDFQLICFSSLSPKVFDKQKMSLLLSNFLYEYIWSLGPYSKKWDFMAIHLLSSWLPQHILFEIDIGPFHVRPTTSSQWLCISTSFTGLALFFAILKMTEESMMRSSTPLSEPCHNQLIMIYVLLLSHFAHIRFFCLYEPKPRTVESMSLVHYGKKIHIQCWRWITLINVYVDAPFSYVPQLSESRSSYIM